MTSEECVDIIKNGLIDLIDGGQLKATYNQSNSTISFYVNDISIDKRPLLTLRVSDHRPAYQNYIHTDLTPPSPEENTNVSIEFYKPKYREDGRLIKNKIKPKVNVPQDINGVIPFIVNSYSYTPRLLEKSDVEEIYNAILNWINGGLNAKYIDPFANTYKKANPQTKIANIKWNISHNMSVDNNGNYVSAKGWGADYVSESNDIYKYNQNNCNRNMRNKQVVRLTESDLHRIVKESVNKVLKEDYMNHYFNTGISDGHFADALYKAYSYASSSNQKRLRDAFPDLLSNERMFGNEEDSFDYRNFPSLDDYNKHYDEWKKRNRMG